MVLLQEPVTGVWNRFWEVAPVVAVLAAAVWGLWILLGKKEEEIKKLNDDLKEYSKDYKELANKSLSVLILVDDKLKNDNHSNDVIKEVHRIVQEILEIEKKRSQPKGQ